MNVQDILQSVSSIPHTLAWIESEIERISAVKPTIGAEPRPYASKASLPWERPDDGSEVPTRIICLHTQSDSPLRHFPPLTPPSSCHFTCWADPSTPALERGQRLHHSFHHESLHPAHVDAGRPVPLADQPRPPPRPAGPLLAHRFLLIRGMNDAHPSFPSHIAHQPPPSSTPSNCPLGTCRMANLHFGDLRIAAPQRPPPPQTTPLPRTP